MSNISTEFTRMVLEVFTNNPDKSYSLEQVVYELGLVNPRKSEELTILNVLESQASQHVVLKNRTDSLSDPKDPKTQIYNYRLNPDPPPAKNRKPDLYHIDKLPPSNSRNLPMSEDTQQNSPVSFLSITIRRGNGYRYE